MSSRYIITNDSYTVFARCSKTLPEFVKFLSAVSTWRRISTMWVIKNNHWIFRTPHTLPATLLVVVLRKRERNFWIVFNVSQLYKVNQLPLSLFNTLFILDQSLGKKQCCPSLVADLCFINNLLKFIYQNKTYELGGFLLLLLPLQCKNTKQKPQKSRLVRNDNTTIRDWKFSFV